MKTAGLVGIGILSLIMVGCASAPGPAAAPPASVAGEWLGNATVGPTIGCCRGGSGPVRLLLEQKGTAVSGSVIGLGFRGRVSATVSGTELWGSCDCTSSNSATNLPIEASLSGNDMVLRLGNSGMTLNRTP
jgi:hypothetical protein